MTLAHNVRPLPHRNPAPPPNPSRISFRQPVSRAGFIDAAWWPRSRDLTAELPALMTELWAAERDITRVTYNLDAWDHAPRLLLVDGRAVRLGGFRSSDPVTVRLSGPWGYERIDVLVIDPAADPQAAERALQLAARSDHSYRAADIVGRSGLVGSASA